jgi:uncharacterized protein (UPF0333 family)
MTKHRKQVTLGLSLAVAIALLVPSTVAAQSSSAKSTAPATPAKAPAAAPATAKSNAHATETVEYKDGEDMTTRYRPGNNKTTAVSPDATKPVSNGKEKVTFPACDGASKDAAKCAAPPPTPSAQAATHKGKVDSFTIKQ